MAKIQTFQETWNGGTVHPQWINGFNTGTISVVSGQLEIGMPSGNTLYRGYQSPTFSLIDSYFSARIVNAGNQSLTSLEVYPVQIKIDASNMVWIMVATNNVYAYKRVSGSTTQITSVAYNSTTHSYFKIRESNGVCYWETSPDGITYTTLHSEANPISLSSVYHEISVGTWASEGSSTTVILDDFNYIRSNRPGNDNYLKAGNGISTTGRIK